MKKHFCYITLLLCMYSCAQSPKETLQEMRKFGLGPSHPLVIDLEKLISDKSDISDASLEKFRGVVRELEAQSSEGAGQEYLCDLYGSEVPARCIYVRVRSGTNKEQAESLLSGLYSAILEEKVRRNVVSIHPSKDGALVVVTPEFIPDLYMVLFKLPRGFAIQFFPTVEDAYARIFNKLDKNKQ